MSISKKKFWARFRKRSSIHGFTMYFDTVVVEAETQERAEAMFRAVSESLKPDINGDTFYFLIDIYGPYSSWGRAKRIHYTMKHPRKVKKPPKQFILRK